MEHLNTIKETVREVMTTDSKTRNSDQWLILQTLRRLGFKIYLDYKDLKDMPSFESITRARRYWQNTEKILLPTEKTDDKRKAMQENYKDTFR